jgi:hypothetical protein
MFYQNHLAMNNTADVTDDQPIAAWSQSISGENAIKPLVHFYDIYGRKSDVLFFYLVPDNKQDHISFHLFEMKWNFWKLFKRK